MVNSCLNRMNIFSVFRIASEDVGLGDPSALPLAVAAFQVGNQGEISFPGRRLGGNQLY